MGTIKFVPMFRQELSRSFFGPCEKYGMPRRQPLPGHELKICARLREFRKRTGLSRVAFAQKAGIDSSVLVRYEHGRVPLKYVHAWRLMRTFLINPVYLMTGAGGYWTRAAQISPGPEVLKCPEAALFSEVYEKAFADGAWIKKSESRQNHLTPAELRARYEWGFQHWIRTSLIELPDKFVPEFSKQLQAAGEAMLKKFPSDPPEVVKERAANYQSDLDTDVRLRLQGTL